MGTSQTEVDRLAEIDLRILCRLFHAAPFVVRLRSENFVRPAATYAGLAEVAARLRHLKEGGWISGVLSALGMEHSSLTPPAKERLELENKEIAWKSWLQIALEGLAAFDEGRADPGEIARVRDAVVWTSLSADEDWKAWES